MNKLAANLLAEFIGTLGFVFFGTMVVHYSSGNLLYIALGHGIALSILITACMPTSGGHLNPAVTLGFLVTGRMKLAEAVPYIISQLLGAVVGSLLIYAVNGGGDVGAELVTKGTFAIGKNVAPASALLAEIIATFFLIYMIHGTAVDPRAKSVGGFGIGLTVFCDICSIGPISGACMNPARMFGPHLVSTLLGKPDIWVNNWIYWVGPILGACVAAILYTAMLMPRDER